MTVQSPSITYVILYDKRPSVEVYEFEVSGRGVLLPDQNWAKLTEKEYEIFLLMVEGSLNQFKGRSFAYDFIQKHVWPERKATDKMGNAIEKHVSAIRQAGVPFIKPTRKQGYYLDAIVQVKKVPREQVPREIPPQETRAEVVPAEVVPAEVMPTEVMPTEVVPAAVVPAEVVSAAVVPQPAPSSEMAEAVAKQMLDPELTFYSMAVAVLLIAAVTTALTAILRSALTQAQQTITQAPQFGWVLGLLQGVAGALIWSLPLAIVFLRRWFRGGEDYGTWSGGLERPWTAVRTLAMACVVGFTGGLMVDMLIMFAQQGVSLEQAKWIFKQPDQTLPSPWTIFTVSHLGWAEPALGVVTCFGCVATLLILLRRTRWKTMLQERHRHRSFREMIKLLFLVFFRFGLWPLLLTFLPVVSTATLLFFVFHRQLSLGRFVGEGAILGGAGFFFVCGTLFALLFEAQGARA